MRPRRSGRRRSRHSPMTVSRRPQRTSTKRRASSRKQRRKFARHVGPPRPARQLRRTKPELSSTSHVPERRRRRFGWRRPPTRRRRTSLGCVRTGCQPEGTGGGRLRGLCLPAQERCSWFSPRMAHTSCRRNSSGSTRREQGRAARGSRPRRASRLRRVSQLRRVSRRRQAGRRRQASRSRQARSQRSSGRSRWPEAKPKAQAPKSWRLPCSAVRPRLRLGATRRRKPIQPRRRRRSNERVSVIKARRLRRSPRSNHESRASAPRLSSPGLRCGRPSRGSEPKTRAAAVTNS